MVIIGSPIGRKIRIAIQQHDVFGNSKAFQNITLHDFKVKGRRLFTIEELHNDIVNMIVNQVKRGTNVRHKRNPKTKRN